jgi:hypothetical protein
METQVWLDHAHACGYINVAQHRELDNAWQHNCYQYDPATGGYTLAVRRVLQLAGLVTVLGLGGFMIVMFRRERSSRSSIGG